MTCHKMPAVTDFASHQGLGVSGVADPDTPGPAGLIPHQAGGAGEQDRARAVTGLLAAPAVEPS